MPVWGYHTILRLVTRLHTVCKHVGSVYIPGKSFARARKKLAFFPGIFDLHVSFKKFKLSARCCHGDVNQIVLISYIRTWRYVKLTTPQIPYQKVCNIRYLDVSWCNLAVTSATLSRCLAANPNVKLLNISHCNNWRYTHIHRRCVF